MDWAEPPPGSFYCLLSFYRHWDHFKTWNFFIIQKHDTFCCRDEKLMQKAVLWKLDWKLINPCILPHIIWNTAHISSGSVIWFLWIWFNLSNGRNMMDHMLPLVDYEDAASSAGFWLFHFPQDNQSLLQMLSSNVLPLAVPGSAIILAKLATEARPALRG